MLEVLYIHEAEVFVKAKLPGFLMFLSFNKCSISALTAPICQSIEEILKFSSQLRTEFHCASPIPYHVFLGCELHIKTFDFERSNNTMVIARLFSLFSSLLFEEPFFKLFRNCDGGALVYSTMSLNPKRLK